MALFLPGRSGPIFGWRWQRIYFALDSSQSPHLQAYLKMLALTRFQKWSLLGGMLGELNMIYFRLALRLEQ